ncbi:TIGR02391 family protein [Nocardioides panaciterrulae]|uniref:Uncharacterized protein (TIGR02391 family) n=1 Tax=Nocardioides panaciterrulae TaxID=661492 RepID=A0A7Y9J911_9ACTN|nr:TIGR02391 family protein [Nocardioides panaciterrulae]NYD40030.1 uncharacterized protein (TIGR02391 family) [Nocardioides panaciterrulae]
MSFIRQIGSSHGITKAKIIHNPGTDDEETREADALIQGESGFFEVDTPIFEGDLVEVPDPRRGPDGVERRLARKVKVNNMGPRNMHHIHVEWGAAPPPRVAPVRRLTFENLHPAVQEAAGSLFADGHYESAVSEAFKSIEVRVRETTGLAKSGAALMGDAFKMDGSVLDVASHEGRSGEDEREGFLHIFRGAMLGIRNPGAHELFQAGDPQQALEYLGFASLLHRRIDAALAKQAGSE